MLPPDTEADRQFPRVVVGGFPTASLTRRQLADLMVSDCLAARRQPERWLPKLVFSSNGQGIALAGRDPSFAQAMQQADLVHADGMSVVFASRMTSEPLPERIATTDFFHDAAEAASEHKLTFFILGAASDQNTAAVEVIQRRYPDAKVVGQHHGYFAEDDDERICAAIRDSGADVLWVALGKPRQELWCIRNRSRLRGIGWVKTCGGLYSFLAGDAPRAPRRLQQWGLEWLYRAWKEPRRLVWRYLTTNPYSLYRLIRHTGQSKGVTR